MRLVLNISGLRICEQSVERCQIGRYIQAQMALVVLPIKEAKVQSLGQNESPGGGNGYPLQCSCLGNSMHRGASMALQKSRILLSIQPERGQAGGEM